MSEGDLLQCCRCVKVAQWLRLAVLIGAVSVAAPVSSVYSETTIAPLATLTGRYDSNIWNRPAELLVPGTKRDDFLTIVGGGAQLLHDGRDIEASLRAVGTFNAFVDHTDRNFFAMTAQGSIGLDRWVDQYVRGASLLLTESLRYSPDPPAFMGGVRAAIQEDDIFLQGVHAFRSNQIINTTTIEGKYPVSRDLAFEGGYTFGLRHYGRIQGDGGDALTNSVFDTITHTWHGGPRYELTRNDSVGASYRQTFFTQSRSSGSSRTFSSNLITLSGDYTKEFLEWKIKVQGGITFAEPVGRTFPSGSLVLGTKVDRDTIVRLSLSRQGRPSSFLQGGAMISNLAQVGISHRIYERLTVIGSVGYAYNELFPNTNATFKSFTALSTLSYKLTRTITADLRYVFRNFDVDRPELQYQVSRHQVGFMLSIALDPLQGELWD